MPISSVDWQTKGSSIIERALLFLQYLTKLINLLSTLLHQLSNYTCIKASSAIYWVLRNNVDIFLVAEGRNWPKPNMFKAKTSQNILFKGILDSNSLAKYLNNWQPKAYTKDWNAFGFGRRLRPLVNLWVKELWDLQEMKVCVVVSMGKVSFSLGKTLEWSWTPEELASKAIVYKSCNELSLLVQCSTFIGS